MFKKILIANRGEIAVRIIRTCREMGIETVAVFSDADKGALHVQLADEAVCIGAAPALESYLNIEKILQVATELSVEAIHPGYGFLAENPIFARRCEQEGLIFVGSNHESIRLLGDKVESRETMQRAGIPIIPGMEGGGGDLTRFEQEAERIGYAVLIKATAGGGGKGMRIVHSPTQLKDSLEAAMREAKAAFGNETVYLEKFIEKPRHIEFQMLADHHGNVVHLFERECSIQRRHQKIIEETPSTAVTPELRKRMGATALEVVRAAGYTNAGTVEFLLDQNGDYYFLEVNTRIQVEHPITEMTVGIDLVKHQLLIASGEKLSFQQDALQQRGHSIECRIYAEDPANQFLPSFGKILLAKLPEGPGIRNDAAIFTGYEVSMHYDPILAKLIVWGETREDARRKMIRALEQYVILGIETTIPFLKDVMQHPEFIAGNTCTDFIPMYLPDWKPSEQQHADLLDQGLLVAALAQMNKLSKSATPAQLKPEFSPWQRIGKWAIGE